jgi:hypothetical protein
MSRLTFVPTSADLHRRARAFVQAFEAGEPPPEPFDSLAVDLARFQAENVPGFARLLGARGIDPAELRLAGEVPAVPTDVFKLARVATFAAGEETQTFRTSGTTQGQDARGVHSFRDVGTYDRGAVAFGRASLVADLLPPGNMSRVPILVLGPSPEELPDSSLTHMNALFVAAFGAPASTDETYFVKDEVLDVVGLDERVARLMVGGSKGALVLATSFALVHFLEAVGDAPFRLPAGSRVMQTGGFKGKSREVDAATLRRDVARAFCLDERSVVSEYGMTELSSQFYERTAVDADARPGVYREPPWARVVPVHPETLEPVPHGEIGIARIEDLLNVDSAFAVLTADRVRRVDDGTEANRGFELLGRAPGAPPRGCSLSIDEMLSAPS